MATKVVQTVYVREGDRAPREGKLHATEFSPGDRTGRALKLLLGFWAAAIVAVAIPIAHWILVPAFLLAGPVLAYRRYRQTQASETVELCCPACGAEQSIAVDAGDTVPFYVYCPKCNAGLQLTAQ